MLGGLGSFLGALDRELLFSGVDRVNARALRRHFPSAGLQGAALMPPVNAAQLRAVHSPLPAAAAAAHS